MLAIPGGGLPGDGVPPLRRWGTPCPRLGYPPIQGWIGTPSNPRLGYPPEMGYPPIQGWGTPPVQGWIGTPPPRLDRVPPRNVNRQTPVKTVPSCHTAYAGGKKRPCFLPTPLPISYFCLKGRIITFLSLFFTKRVIQQYVFLMWHPFVKSKQLMFRGRNVYKRVTHCF